MEAASTPSASSEQSSTAQTQTSKKKKSQKQLTEKEYMESVEGRKVNPIIEKKRKANNAAAIKKIMSGAKEVEFMNGDGSTTKFKVKELKEGYAILTDTNNEISGVVFE